MRAVALLLLALPLLGRAEQELPPFITTPDEVVERMLELAGTTPGDMVVDLGSGDGRIVIAAAQRFGARGLGIELDPRLVARSRENARLANVAERVAFVRGDVLLADISQASVVTLYLLPQLIDRLQPRLLHELQPGTRIVSHAFGMIGWQPDRAETMRLAQRHPGQGDASQIFLWIVPASARGEWQAADVRISIQQNFQELEIEGSVGARPIAAHGRVSGRDIGWEGRGARFRGRIEGSRMVGELMLDGRAEQVVLSRGR
jgi:SAM-dependent methyltransferase